jgi:hypothetical protein
LRSVEAGLHTRQFISLQYVIDDDETVTLIGLNLVLKRGGRS